MAEFALGALAGKEGKFLGVSFALNITPDCDCYPWSDAAMVPDVGILAGTDPVALDQASYDLVNAQEGLPGTALGAQGSLGGRQVRGRAPRGGPHGAIGAR